VHVVDDADRAVDPASFVPREVETAGRLFVLAAESFRGIRGELEALHEAHWLETEKHRHGLALRPDYPALDFDERVGRLVQFTARCDGALVGHLRMYLGCSRHTSTRFAQEDTLYVIPECRGGMLGLALMRYAERCLLQMGVREIRADSKLVNHADVLMRRLGYTPVATQFVKVFPEEKTNV
jgi:GNAT superfamily N-acetyltransferase